MDPPPLSHSSSSHTSLPILAISIVGILATAILLLSYYLFIINCCLHWRRPGGAAHLLPFRGVHRHAEPSRDFAPPHGPREARGLDPAAIRSIPTLRFARAAGSKPCPVDECAVCLADFEERELLRVLPGCGHPFHVDCIDTWLQYSSAICPLCRLDVSRVQPIHNFVVPEGYSGVAVAAEAATDVGYNAGSAAAAEAAAATELVHTPPPIRRSTPKVRKQKKLWQAASMGDECIDISREKDERFAVQQPIRRSFSMDSSNDRSLFLSVQETLQRNREVLLDIRRGEGSGGGGGGGNASGRIRRSFFSFGRSSRSTTAVLPVVQSELC